MATRGAATEIRVARLQARAICCRPACLIGLNWSDLLELAIEVFSQLACSADELVQSCYRSSQFNILYFKCDCSFLHPNLTISVAGLPHSIVRLWRALKEEGIDVRVIEGSAFHASDDRALRVIDGMYVEALEIERLLELVDEIQGVRGYAEFAQSSRCCLGDVGTGRFRGIG